MSSSLCSDRSKLTISSTVKLASGYDMPVLGYGVYQVPSADCPRLVTCALSTGYRYIDTATAYRNESACASAVLQASTLGVPIPSLNKRKIIPREEIYFTTKLPPRKRGYEQTRESIQKTIAENPGLEGYVDLYLIHAPYGGKDARLGEWRAMRDEWREGRVRSLGVSNFSIKHIQEIQDWITEEEVRTGEPGSGGVISVGQWEIHPWCPRHDIVSYCHQNNIAVQAYSPLVRATRFAPNSRSMTSSSLDKSKSSEAFLMQLATKYRKTPAQILLRWSLDMGLVPVVKSVHEERIIENAGVFGWGEFPDEEEIKALDTGGYEPICWDPVRDCVD